MRGDIWSNSFAVKIAQGQHRVFDAGFLVAAINSLCRPKRLVEIARDEYVAVHFYQVNHSRRLAVPGINAAIVDRSLEYVGVIDRDFACNSAAAG